MAEKCVEQGFNVKAFIHYNSKNNWGWLESSKYKKHIEFVTGDIRDYDSVYNAMKGADTVFHLAALIRDTVFLHIAGGIHQNKY